MTIAFDNSYARLPDRFFARVTPTPVAQPRLIRLNHGLAAELGLDADRLSSPEGVEMLAGNRVGEASEPISMAYAGHQFGQFVPQLGDGRAILLGEVVDRHGRRRDIQLKGSGLTPFSRQGDGRAALGPVLREYVVSEAMVALGVPTTRSLAVVASGERVRRERWLPGGVLTRVASSHIRVGTFQFFAARGDVDGVRALADHAIARHYPDAAAAENPYRAFLEAVTLAQADLVARWILIGFIHGVLNTDNTAVSGETIDYGPCAFMDAYHPATVFSSIDVQGRYAYANQPRIVHWNLTRLAETLLPLLADDQDAAVAAAEAILGEFPGRFEARYYAGLRAKLGLATEDETDPALAGDLLRTMAEGQADFTLVFRRLADAAADPARLGDLRDLFLDPTRFDPWAARWRERIDADGGDPAARAAAMRAVNPITIPRNHQVEAVIVAAVERDDFAPFHRLVEVLADPFTERDGLEAFTRPPEPHERVLQTFCGT